MTILREMWKDRHDRALLLIMLATAALPFFMIATGTTSR